MAQATFSVRMDEGLKADFETLCKEFGMNMSVAINIFAKTVVREKRIPFEITTKEKTISNEEALAAFQSLRAQAKENNLSDMTLDEINDEIKETRESTR